VLFSSSVRDVWHYPATHDSVYVPGRGRHRALNDKTAARSCQTSLGRSPNGRSGRPGDRSAATVCRVASVRGHFGTRGPDRPTSSSPTPLWSSPLPNRSSVAVACSLPSMRRFGDIFSLLSCFCRISSFSYSTLVPSFHRTLKLVILITVRTLIDYVFFRTSRVF